MVDPAHIERVRARLAEVENELSRPETAASPARLRERMTEHLRLRTITELATRRDRLAREREESRALATADDPELRALALAELPHLDEELPAAERALLLALLPPDPAEARNIIMEIRAGTGGDEAALFAGDLFRMYQHYAAGRGWKVGVVDTAPAELGGFKEIVFSVEGEQVFAALRYESGVHRVQRVPATEAQGRIHTSTATVAVLSRIIGLDALDIPAEDIRLDLYRASGPGGQKVNKTESAVRLTHLPTGLVVQCQDERSQGRNKDKAMRVLRARLLDRRRADEAARAADARRSQIGTGDRSERIRTYNFPQNRLTDHRIGLTLYQLDRIIEGDLDPLLRPLRDRDLDDRLGRL